MAREALGVAVLVAGLTCAFAAGAAPADDMAKGDAAFRAGDMVGAAEMYKRAADAGHAPAQVRLAEIRDASEDDAAALELYRRAAAQNYAPGIHGVGLMFAKGEGTARNPAEALNWYRRAAAMDYLPSVEAIAWAYLVGDLGLAPDKAEADAWGDRVAKLGGKRPTLKPAATNPAAKQAQKPAAK